MSETKFKVRKHLAIEQYVKTLILKTSCHIKELVDYENSKLDPQLISDLMNFIESEIAESKYSTKDIDKKELVLEVLNSVFNLKEEEQTLITKMIEHALENGIVKRRGFFSSLGRALLRLLRLLVRL